MLRRTFLGALASAPLALGKTEQRRQIILDGARNFRDIGGYPTVDGRSVRWGRVFRSDALHNLTDADYRTLAKLRIRVICDYRAQTERDREPTKWRGSKVPEVQVLDIMAANPQTANADPTATFMNRLMRPGMTAEGASKMMADSMAEMSLTAGPLYGRMMRRIINSDLPLLYHCSAGKDRTGLSTALLMKVIGVQPEAIVEDYLLVNTINPPDRAAAEMGPRISQLAGQQIDINMVMPLLGTQRAWLDAAFDAIDKEFGGFDGYREKALGLTTTDVARLRSTLVR